MSEADKLGRRTWLVLQQLVEDLILAPRGEHARHEIEKSKVADYPSVPEQTRIIARLISIGAIQTFGFDFANPTSVVRDLPVQIGKNKMKGILFEKMSPKFDEVYTQYSKYDDKNQLRNLDTYRMSMKKGNEIWINDFLLSRPHATGRPLTLFEYVYQNPNKQIVRKNMPQWVQDELSGKRFIRMLNDLGFKHEIREAFFRKVAKSQLYFRSEVSKAELEDDGIDIRKFLSQLKEAHKKYFPK